MSLHKWVADFRGLMKAGLQFLTDVTGENNIKMQDNLADALSIKEGSNSYLKFTTTDASEGITLGQNVTITSGKTLTVGGVVQSPAASLTTGSGAGITDGVGAISKTSVKLEGGIYKTTIILDLTGTASSTTDLDIIGTGTNPAYIAKLTAAECGGTIDMIRMTCLELPAGGADDIDLYSAVEGTGKFDDAIASTLTETALLTSGGAWANGTVKGATVCPASTEYLYLTGGEGGTAAAYTAGKFIIEIYGH